MKGLISQKQDVNVMQALVHSFTDLNAVQSEAVSPKCVAFYSLMPTILKITGRVLAK